MTIADVYAKIRYCYRCLMESPIGSQERVTWKRIIRELEQMKNALTAGTANGA